MVGGCFGLGRVVDGRRSIICGIWERARKEVGVEERGGKDKK